MFFAENIFSVKYGLYPLTGSLHIIFQTKYLDYFTQLATWLFYTIGGNDIKVSFLFLFTKT